MGFWRRRAFGNAPRRCFSVLKQNYEEMMHSNGWRSDPHQLKALSALERLHSQLETSSSSLSSPYPSWLSTASLEASKGIYLHGGPGCGKTMLMNLFYDTIVAEDKQQVHFHEFIMGIHQSLYRAKQQKQKNPIQFVTKETFKRGKLLCLDEFQVTDIADALMIKSMLEEWWELGGILVATSNRAPENLYENGLQRELFVPLIKSMPQHLEIISMDASPTDYRQRQASRENYRFVGKEGLQEMNQLWPSTTSRLELPIPHSQRTLTIPRAHGKMARFSFSELCDEALGTADYWVLAKAMNTIVIDQIPTLNIHERNRLRRFINLVDALYESQCTLWLHLEKEPLFEKPNHVVHDEAFSVDRSLSRIQMMTSSN